MPIDRAIQQVRHAQRSAQSKPLRTAYNGLAAELAGANRLLKAVERELAFLKRLPR